MRCIVYDGPVLQQTLIKEQQFAHKQALRGPTVVVLTVGHSSTTQRLEAPQKYLKKQKTGPQHTHEARGQYTSDQRTLMAHNGLLICLIWPFWWRIYWANSVVGCPETQ